MDPSGSGPRARGGDGERHAIASGTDEAVQYGPAFNSLGVAWQVYHGDGANAVAGMRYAYSNGVVIYLNGRPLVFAMNPGGLRGTGVMARVGDAVYLPLQRGSNQIVFAVIQRTGGWAFSASLDP